MLFRGLVILAGIGILMLVIRRLARLLKRSIDWREYEHKTADRMKKNGREKVKVSRGTKDGGYDVKGKKDGVWRYIQCKMYTTTKVTVKQVREIFGVATLYGGKPLIVTSGNLTRDAEREARVMGVQVKYLVN